MSLSLRARLISLFALIGIIPLVIIGYYAYTTASSAMRDAAFNKLTVVRNIKITQLQTHFESMIGPVMLLSQSQDVLQAFDAFIQYHDDLELDENDAYGVNTPEYEALYNEYDFFFKQFSAQLDFYDLFLICAPHGHVMFTVEQEKDLGTNLGTGPYRESHLADLWREVVKTQQLVIKDYEPYAPSNGEPACFFGAPIKNESGQMIGVLAAQVSPQGINDIMQEKEGMGKTGEAYLVGHDKRMRSDSRLSQEHTIEKSFRGSIEQNGVDTEAVQEALAGVTDTRIIEDYRGEKVLSAFAPLKIRNLNWAIMAEIDQTEAFEAVYNIRFWIFIIAVAIALITVGVGWYFANSIGRPLAKIASVISSSSSQIAATVKQHEQTAAQQSSSVNETTTTMEELRASSRQSAEQAESATTAAQSALDVVQKGNKVVEEALQGMNNLKTKVSGIASQILELSEQTAQIQMITRLVRDLADQTNLLALNAAVEAARAGEHGRGFAVVATEIRKLADESKQSAEKISDLVSSIQQATNSTVMATEEGTKTVDRGIELVQQTTGAFNEVSVSVGTSFDNIQQIALNVQQQAQAVKQVVEAMNSINAGAKETASGLAQTKVGIDQLNTATHDLNAMM